MPNIIVILALLALTAPAAERADPVRIGLFTLFKPQVCEARIVTGDRVMLDAGSISGNQTIAPGGLIRIRLAGNRLNIALSDSFGRVQKSLDATEARITPHGSATIELTLPGKMKRAVRGHLSVTAGARALKIVLTTDRESAVASVTAAEIGSSREPEAIKALAVVVRTFMLSHEGRHSGEGFDFCDTTHCQFYRGESDLSAEAASPVIASAVAATEGEYLSFDRKPVESYFTAVCGGRTVTPEMAWGGASGKGYQYHRVVCRWCRASVYADWQRSASETSAFDALSTAVGFRLSHASEIILDSEGPGGFVRSIIIKDRGRQARMSADEFRRAIGRRLGWSKVLSPSFAIERRGRTIVFRGKGFGSQVGLCLAGAAAQADAGRGYREILQFYYPRTEIRNRATNE
jgi:stage II sporulation protein D